MVQHSAQECYPYTYGGIHADAGRGPELDGKRGANS